MPVNYLRKMDTFGVPIELCFEKRKMHKTSWGGFWTMTIFLFSVSVFIILGLEIVYREKPNVISIEQLERNNSNITIQEQQSQNNNNNNDNLNNQRATYASSGVVLALALLDENYKIIPYAYDSIKITGYFISQKGFQLLNEKQTIEFIQCNELELLKQDNNNNNLYNEFDLKELICLKNENDNIDYYLTGELGSQLYNHIQIQVEYKQPINIELQQNLSYVGIFFTDQMMDVQNYNNPLTKYRKNIIFQIQMNNSYDLLIRNQHASIITDKGLIWEDTNSQSFFFLKDYKINNSNQVQNKLFTIQTETDPKLLVYRRSYMKLTDLLATMGGFIKALMIAGFILANPVAKLSLKTELVNRLFNFEGIDELDDKNIDQQQTEQYQSGYLQQQSQSQSQQNKLTKLLHKSGSNISNSNLNDKSLMPSNQITLNFNKSYNSTRNNLGRKNNYIEYNNNLSGTATNLDTLNSKIMPTQMNQTQPIQLINLQNTNNFSIQKSSYIQNSPLTQKNSKLNQLSLLKIARRKNQSLNDLSSINLPQFNSKKSLSPVQSQISRQKDKVQLVRTMLRSFVSQHSMKQEDCIKASTILGQHTKKKEDPDAVFKKLFKSNEKTLTMKLWDYIKYFIGLKNEVKNKQINFSMRKVNERLDIVFIMKKLIEVDKLKMLFLNENQRKLFEYLPRPIVRLDPDQQHIESCENQTLNQEWARQMFFNDKNYISKASEAMIAYQDILKKGNKIDQLDQKLIDMLDESKKEFFQIESPKISPNGNGIGNNKRNSLSIINSINHSPKQKQNENNNNNKNSLFLNGLKNISNAESIELNEQDIQEIKTHEIIRSQDNQNNKNGYLEQFNKNYNNVQDQNINTLLDKYNNRQCFNKKNTKHFMKQNSMLVKQPNNNVTQNDNNSNQLHEQQNDSSQLSQIKLSHSLIQIDQIKNQQNNNNNNLQQDNSQNKQQSTQNPQTDNKDQKNNNQLHQVQNKKMSNETISNKQQNKNVNNNSKQNKNEDEMNDYSYQNSIQLQFNKQQINLCDINNNKVQTPQYQQQSQQSQQIIDQQNDSILPFSKYHFFSSISNQNKSQNNNQKNSNNINGDYCDDINNDDNYFEKSESPQNNDDDDDNTSN